MLSVKLMGGLGNQLFQIFNLISYSLENNKQFIIPYSKTLKSGKERPTYWDSFLKKLKIFTKSDVSFPYYREKQFHFEEIPKNMDNIMFFGYYQSYHYFKNHYNTIINMFDLKSQQEQVLSKNNSYFDENKISVSMHFRMDDYKNNKCHPIMTYEYYINSLDRIITLIGDNFKVLYFCQDVDEDDVNKIISKIKYNYENIQFEKVKNDLPDYEQLLLMSCCDHNIIANSTFSWWGAYFNNNENKIVCYPSIWFAGELLKYNVADLFPDKWIKINLKKKSEIILLILNCEKYRNKAIIQKKSWLKNLPKNMIYYHVIGKPSLFESNNNDYLFDDEERILYVNTKDDYTSLPAKVITALNSINNEYNYNYIYKTDDDQLLIKDNFFSEFLYKKLNNEIKYYYGGHTIELKHDVISTYYTVHDELSRNLILEKTKYSNGRFYFLHKEAVKNLIIKKKDISKREIEDHAIGYFLDEKYKKNILNFNNNLYFVDSKIIGESIFGYYINLEERDDRRKHIENIKKEHHFLYNLSRFNAIKNDTNGHIGCALSHIECLTKLKQENNKYNLVLEDDFKIFNRKHFNEFVSSFEYIKDKDWDIIVLTPSGKTLSKYYKNYNRIVENQTATGYIIKNSFIDILIENFKYGTDKLKKGENPNHYALDQIWKTLQHKYKFIYFNKIFGGQLEGYSSIEKKNVNYNERFKNQDVL